MILKVYSSTITGEPTAFYCENCHLVTYPNHDVCPACHGILRSDPLPSIFSKEKPRPKYRKKGEGQVNFQGYDVKALRWGVKKKNDVE